MPKHTRFLSHIVANLLMVSMGTLISQTAQARTVVISRDGFAQAGEITLTFDMPDSFDFIHERDWSNAIERAAVAFSGSQSMPAFQGEWSKSSGGSLTTIVDGLSAENMTLGDQGDEHMSVSINNEQLFLNLEGHRSDAASDWMSSFNAAFFAQGADVVCTGEASLSLAHLSAVPEASTLATFSMGLLGLLGMATVRRSIQRR